MKNKHNIKTNSQIVLVRGQLLAENVSNFISELNKYNFVGCYDVQKLQNYENKHYKLFLIKL